MLRLACAAVVAVLAAGGCGGGSSAPERTAAKGSAAEAGEGGAMSEQEREKEERKHVPGKRLSARDRVAYYQIATTSGLLRARASTVLTGLRGTSRATLVAGRERLDLLRPEDKALAALAGALERASDALLRGESRPAARAAMRATDRINADLARYSRGKAVRLLVPD